MNELESLAKLRQTWPETTDYLRQVGQVNNDLSVLREISQRDEYEASLTWLDQLAVSVEDLTKHSNPVLVLKHLNQQGVTVSSTSQVLDYEEIRVEHLELYETGRENSPDVLDGPVFELVAASEEALWALPEFQSKLISWATETAIKHGYQGPALTLAQASILMNVWVFLDQEPEHSPGWAEECLQSALSSDFFEKAANPTK